MIYPKSYAGQGKWGDRAAQGIKKQFSLTQKTQHKMKAITTREDAINFIHQSIIWVGIAFHPDTRFSDYVDGDGNPVFTPPQARLHQLDLEECIDILGSVEDVCEIGLEFARKMGYAPAPDENGEKQPTVVDGYEGPFLSGLEAEFFNFCKNDSQMVEEFAAHMLQNGKQFLGFEIDWNAEVDELCHKRAKAIQYINKAVGEGLSIGDYYVPVVDDNIELRLIKPKGDMEVELLDEEIEPISQNQMAASDWIELAAHVQKAIAERNPQP